jgi:hypothetical protein
VTSWLGVALAAALGLVTLRCGLRRDVPGAVMAAGMAVMSLGMGGIGPTFVHGPWWAAGFAAVAVWPLVRPPRAGVRGGRTAHLLGGVAMIYMCALPPMGGAEPTPADHAVPVAPTGHHGMAGMGAVDLPAAPMTMPGPLGAALTLLGWALACYFLLATVTALTRRTTGGAAGVSRLTVLTEATMGLGTMVMLTACT